MRRTGLQQSVIYDVSTREGVGSKARVREAECVRGYAKERRRALGKKGDNLT